MNPAFSDVELESLVEARSPLKSGSIMRLPNAVECAYVAHTNKQLLGFRRAMLLLGVVMACVLSLSEILIYQELWADLALLAYSLALPYFIFCGVLVGSRFFVRHQEAVILMIGVLCAAIVTVVLCCGPETTVLYIINTYILLLVFVSGVLQLSVKCVLWMTVISWVLFNICVLWVNTRSLQWVVLYNATYATVAWVVMYFSYQLSVSKRKQFLQALLIESERDKIRAIRTKVRTLSSTDAITGVANRQELDKTIYAEWRRLCRNDDDLSIMMVDVDDFGQYNRIHGHKQGDVALVDVAKAIQDAFKRATDTVGRYNGDTFMVILPETAKGEAELMCRSVCKRVRELSQADGASEMTVSIGVVSCRPEIKQNYDVIISQAKSALKQAKLNGKDQYCVANLRSY